MTLVPLAGAQQGTIKGTVHDSTGKLVGDASVRLERKDVPGVVGAKTSAAGDFVFSALPVGSYTLSAEKSGLRSRSTTVVASPDGNQKPVDLVLDADSAASAAHREKACFVFA